MPKQCGTYPSPAIAGMDGEVLDVRESRSSEHQHVSNEGSFTLGYERCAVVDGILPWPEQSSNVRASPDLDVRAGPECRVNVAGVRGETQPFYRRFVGPPETTYPDPEGIRG